MTNSDPSENVQNLDRFQPVDLSKMLRHVLTAPLRPLVRGPIAKGVVPIMETVVEGSGFVSRIKDDCRGNPTARIQISGQINEEDVYSMDCLICTDENGQPEIKQFYDGRMGVQNLLRIVSFPSLSDELRDIGLSQEYLRSLKVDETARLAEKANECIFKLLDKHTCPIDNNGNPLPLTRTSRPIRI